MIVCLQFGSGEIEALKRAVESSDDTSSANDGTSIVVSQSVQVGATYNLLSPLLQVLADWYDPEVVQRSLFHDDNTRSYWTPVTGVFPCLCRVNVQHDAHSPGGANVPALNDLLRPYGVAFGGHVYAGMCGASSRYSVICSYFNCRHDPWTRQ
jgi:hypothetical protein